jgi:RimJ/RimL family protein N-acetyltransferase
VKVFRVARLHPVHAEAYQALRLRGLRDHPEAFTSSFEEDQGRPLSVSRSRLTASADLPHDAFFGAWQAQQLLGVVGLQGRYRMKERHTATVVGTFVPSEWRGLGVGHALMQALLEHARACPDLRQLDLTVTEGNDPARCLYERLGFSTWGICPEAVLVGGVYAGKVHMTLRLR